MPNNMAEASQAAGEMFASDEQLTLDNVPEETVESTEEQEAVTETEEAETEPTQENAMLGDAVNTAELAAETATQAVQELEALKRQNAQLTEQNEAMQSTIEELSVKNEENVIEELLEPPMLDINALAFADEDTVKTAQEDYARKMSEYTKRQMMDELSPALEYAKAGLEQREKEEALEILSKVPGAEEIRDFAPQLDMLIKENAWLRSEGMPMLDRYANAYAFLRGIRSINTPPLEQSKPSAEELMALYKENPEFRELIEKERIEQLNQGQQVPPFSASSGASNAALNIKEKPKNLEEASARVRKLFAAE